MTPPEIVYMDHAATTPVHPEVLQAMLPYFTEKFANPSSIYSIAGVTRTAIEDARAKVAKAIGASPDEIYFTSGGTESDNWAIKGIAYANRKKGNHIITSAIEHHAVLHTCDYLEKQGFAVTYVPVDKYGVIDLAKLREAITPQTILITVMFANNEIGTIEPIAEIGKLAREKGIYFHTDAVQAVGHVPTDVKALQVDLLSLSAHKFYGPKGTGALYIRKGVKIDNFMHGGGQEKRKRASTENVPGIVGLGKAIELATADIEGTGRRLRALRERLKDGITTRISHTRYNGHPDRRLPGNVNICFEFIEGESLLLLLSQQGICGSTGSACTSASLEPSHVLLAIGLPHEIAHGSLRLTMGDANTEAEVDYVLEVLPKIVDKLRQMSPLYEKVTKGVC
ncbi:MAG: cysteine desulfurase NifS [Methanoregulaceae archaeon]